MIRAMVTTRVSYEDFLTQYDGRHAEWFWRREFPAAYRWLFADPARPARPARRVPPR